MGQPVVHFEIGARDYKRITEDDLLVEEDTESPLEVNIELQKGR